MASIGVIFTSTYHTKQLNPWPNSSASRVVNYSQLSACQGDMQPFEGDPYTHGCLTNLRNKPQQKQPGQLSAPIPGWIVSQRVQLLFDGEKCVLLLCAWKPAFLKSGYIWISTFRWRSRDSSNVYWYIWTIRMMHKSIWISFFRWRPWNSCTDEYWCVLTIEETWCMSQYEFLCLEGD